MRILAGTKPRCWRAWIPPSAFRLPPFAFHLSLSAKIERIPQQPETTTLADVLLSH